MSKKIKVPKLFFDWINSWGNLEERKHPSQTPDYMLGYKHAIMDVLERIK